MSGLVSVLMMTGASTEANGLLLAEWTGLSMSNIDFKVEDADPVGGPKTVFGCSNGGLNKLLVSI